MESSAPITSSSHPQKDTVEPNTHLDLSASPIDGSLLTTNLYTVLNAATDGLYRDLHALTHDSLTLVVPTSISTSATTTTTNADDEKVTSLTSTSKLPSNTTTTIRKGTMASFAFQERRHLLATTIARHAKSISHVAALVASYLPQSGSASNSTSQISDSQQQQLQQQYSHHHKVPSEFELSEITSLVSKALVHVRESWVSADEAQDALYFHHDTLWKARSHPHDVVGAMNVYLKGIWRDLPTDVKLVVDAYQTSHYDKMGKDNVKELLKSVVRRKLILGEVGVFGVETLSTSRTSINNNQRASQKLPWKITLEKGGYAITCVHGSPILKGNVKIYPIEARLTVLAEDAISKENSNSNNNNDDDNDDNDDDDDGEVRSNHVIAAPWTLLEVQVRTGVKTGESNHQLELSHAQMFQFHKLCVAVMNREEMRLQKDSHKMLIQQPPIQSQSVPKHKNDDIESMQLEDNNAYTKRNISSSSNNKLMIARPLDKLFSLCHKFSISCQMEILSSQADALRKGLWGGSSATHTGVVVVGGGDASSTGAGITVSPIQYLEWDKDSKLITTALGKNEKGSNVNNTIHSSLDEVLKDHEYSRIVESSRPIAVLAIHFWEVDDRFGIPKIGPLTLSTSKLSSDPLQKEEHKNYKLSPHENSSRRLTVEIRAIPRVGIQVFLSGGDIVMSQLEQTQHESSDDPSSIIDSNRLHLHRNVQKLLNALQDPFRLSMSDALLSASIICAQRRCQSVMEALERCQSSNSTDEMGGTIKLWQSLPPWIHLKVDCGAISVAVRISYNHGNDETTTIKRPSVVVFRLCCDSRGGKFVPSFPSSVSLLRQLACNDANASEVQLSHNAKFHSLSSTTPKSSSVMMGYNTIAKEFTGRIVRDAFDSLNRSMNSLGQRVGVGGAWEDIDSLSGALREKSIVRACHDVIVSLVTCAGISVVYGVGAMALKVSAGVNPIPDIAGGPIPSFLSVPPLAVIRHQEMVESTFVDTNGERSSTMLLERDLCALSASISNDEVILHVFDITSTLECPTSLPKRTKYASISLPETDDVHILAQPSKKSRIEKGESEVNFSPLINEAEYLALRLKTLLRNDC